MGTEEDKLELSLEEIQLEFEENCTTMAISLIRDKGLSRAARALLPPKPAKGNGANVKAPEALHREEGDSLPPWVPAFAPKLEFVLSMKHALHHAPRLSAGDPSGCTYEFLKVLCSKDEASRLFPLLSSICTKLANG